jgi:hypothetical protein
MTATGVLYARCLLLKQMECVGAQTWLADEQVPRVYDGDIDCGLGLRGITDVSRANAISRLADVIRHVRENRTHISARPTQKPSGCDKCHSPFDPLGVGG